MFQTRMKHHRRYQEIVNTFIKNGFSHILFRLGLTEGLSKRKSLKSEAELNAADIGVKLRQSLQTLGPTFIKLGQIASSRRDIVPAAIAHELEKLQDDVQPFSYDLVKEVILEELGEDPQVLFAEFDKEPLATASIGQVHLGKLHTGEAVAIKIQRPEIEAIMSTDLEILKQLAAILHDRVEWVRSYRIQEMIEEFAYSLEKELDYRLEGRNGERIANFFSEDEVIHIPKIYWEYTSRKVLTMELVKGIKVNQYEQLNQLGYDTKLIAARIVDAMLAQVLELGSFHGDPHPGNIYVLPNNEIAFLDFGMVGYLSEELQYHFSSLVISLQAKDTEGIIQTFMDWGLLDAVPQMAQLRRDIDRLLVTYYDTPLEQLSLGSVMIEIFSLAYKHRIEIPTDIAILAKAILTLEMVIENLDADLSIMDAVEPYGKKLLWKRYQPSHLAKKSWRRFWENVTILADLPRDMKELSTSLKRGKLQFDINIFEIQYILNKLDRIANRISFSVILLSFSILMMGLIIGAAIVGETTVLWKLPVIEIGFTLTSLIFLFILFAIFRSGKM